MNYKSFDYAYEKGYNKALEDVKKEFDDWVKDGRELIVWKTQRDDFWKRLKKLKKKEEKQKCQVKD